MCYPNSPYYVCQAKANASTTDLKNALNYCCSGVGVDCTAINTGGACAIVVNNSLHAHANWCFAEYYRLHCEVCVVPVDERCDFGGAAELVAGPLTCPHL